jgi:hypothetical protein
MRMFAVQYSDSGLYTKVLAHTKWEAEDKVFQNIKNTKFFQDKSPLRRDFLAVKIS